MTPQPENPNLQTRKVFYTNQAGGQLQEIDAHSVFIFVEDDLHNALELSWNIHTGLVQAKRGKKVTTKTKP